MAEPAAAPAADHGRLLVVDDEPFLRDAVAASLRFLGFDVTTADNGAEALLVLCAPEAVNALVPICFRHNAQLNNVNRATTADSEKPSVEKLLAYPCYWCTCRWTVIGEESKADSLRSSFGSGLCRDRR